MTPSTSMQSRIGLLFAGGALVVAGYFTGTAQQVSVAADETKVESDAAVGGGVLGVPIPNGGAALVKGRDGNAYIVDSRGLFIRASQSGKSLPLP